MQKGVVRYVHPVAFVDFHYLAVGCAEGRLKLEESAHRWIWVDLQLMGRISCGQCTMSTLDASCPQFLQMDLASRLMEAEHADSSDEFSPHFHNA
jgi:hypothetical protein